MIPHTVALHQILTAGIQAPSAENKHYFWFEVGTDQVTLHATDSASWAAHPDRKMLALMSFGAVVENISVRARAMGFLTQARWNFDSSRTVELSWQSAAPLLEPLDGAISTRRTNRRFYQRTPLLETDVAQLRTAAESVDGAAVHWLAAGLQRDVALSLIRTAETERFRRRGLHAEMFGAIRFARGWEGTVLEGLPPAALQVEWPMRWPFAALRSWNSMRVAHVFGAHLALGLRAGYLPCALAPHIGLITCTAADLDTAHVQAGRAFERLWLASEVRGLALQPMAAATVLLNQISGPDWVSAATQKRLVQGWEKLGAQLDTQLSTAQRTSLATQQAAQQTAQQATQQTAQQTAHPNSQHAVARPCMLFRVGRAPAPSAVAGRRPLEYFLKAPPALNIAPSTARNPQRQTNTPLT